MYRSSFLVLALATLAGASRIDRQQTVSTNHVLKGQALKEPTEHDVVWLPGDAKHPALPYGKRGITLEQMELFFNSYMIGKGYDSLRKVCKEFNDKNSKYFDLADGDPQKTWPCKAESPRGYEYAMHTLPLLTDPGVYGTEKAPRAMKWKAPQPWRNLSFAELINPDGVQVDVFISWAWITPVTDIMFSLRKYAEAVYAEVGRKRPEEVTFWMCAFAINQHQIRPELQWDPSMKPFRLGLEHSHKAVLLLDQTLRPLQQAWNMYENLVGFVLGKQMLPIGSGVSAPMSIDNQVKTIQNFTVAGVGFDILTRASANDKKMILELIRTTLLGLDGMTVRMRGMLASALATNYPDAANRADIQQMLPKPWQQPVLWQMRKELISVPECQVGPLPEHLDMAFLTGDPLPEGTVMHQTEVVIRCGNGDKADMPKFLSACKCPTRPDLLSPGFCIWAAPRPQGPLPSCWPTHTTGSLACRDHLPFPLPTGEDASDVSLADLKDLVCKSD